MTALDLEAEYNNRARVKNSAEIIARWAEQSKSALAELPGERDLAYGPKPRQAFDLFQRAGAARPLVVYIHGGYWQRGDRREYAFVARELMAQGCDVALPSYTLCPDGTIAGIVDEMELFLTALWRRTQRRPVLVGHSAGGHLAAVMMASRVPRADAPAELIRAAYALSGVYDLPPLIPTSLNAALRLDVAEARRLSPMFGPKPAHACRFVAAVGGNESSEFIRQASDFAAAWHGAGCRIEADVIAGTDHFTIVDELCRPGSRVLDGVLAMAGEVG